MSSTKPLFARSIIANYDRYLVPLFFEEYARDLTARAAIPAGGRALEIACGTGVMDTTPHRGPSRGDHAGRDRP